MSSLRASQISSFGVGLCLALACASPGHEAPTCLGDRCDDPQRAPTAHARAVLGCDAVRDGELAQAPEGALEAHQKHRACVAQANDSAAAVIEENIALANAPSRSLEEISIVFREFRYASLCTDLEAASTGDPETTALLTARCEAIRERSLAELIGALVEFEREGTGWPLEVRRESFSECFEAAGQGGSEANAQLVSCAAEELLSLAEVLTDAYCAQNACVSEVVTLAFITAGFETAISTSDRACQMLVDAAGLVRSEPQGTYGECRVIAYSELFRSVDVALSSGL